MVRGRHGGRHGSRNLRLLLPLGARAPQYVWVLLVVFGAVIAGAVVAAIVRRRRQGKPVPLSKQEGSIEEDE